MNDFVQLKILKDWRTLQDKINVAKLPRLARLQNYKTIAKLYEFFKTGNFARLQDFARLQEFFETRIT